MANPIQEASSLMARTVSIYWPKSNGLFALLSRVPTSNIVRAIRDRSINPIVRSRVWTGAIEYVRQRAEDRERFLLTRSIAAGYREAGVRTRIRTRAIEIASIEAPGRAVDRIQAIDSMNRRGIRKLVTDAAREYDKSPSVTTLRRLASDVQGRIGVTSRQAGYIGRQVSMMRESGLSERKIDSYVDKKVRQYTSLRANQIADRSIVESIGNGRQLAWEDALEKEEIPPDSMKQWMTQGDETVRDTHDAERQNGPIPIKEVFPIMGVMSAPSNEFG